MVNTFPFPFALLIAACLASGVCADEKSDDKSEKEQKTHTVERGPFEVEVELEGVFEAETMHEVSLQPEVWSTLKVEKAVAEGTSVKEGEPILWLETKKLDDEIRSLKFQQELGYLSLKQAEVELQTLEKSVPLDLEEARRTKQIAEEDLDYFLSVDEEQKRRSAEESLKASQYSLEYAQEELNQLEQMYKADDLTEETEEIILKRAQRDVDRSQFYLESAALRHERTLEFLLPREKQKVQEAATRAELSLMKAEAILPTTVQSKRIELEKLQHAQQQLEEKLELLQGDRELMIVKAPSDGVLYYGEATRGKWSTAANLRKQLRPGGSVSANTVLMTIVPSGPSFVRVDVPEDKYRYFNEGTTAQVKPTAFPDVSYPGECQFLSPVAVKEGTFDGKVSYESKGDSPSPVVGMTCDVILTPRADEDAIAVPSDAVFEEESGDGGHYVYLAAGEEPKKQAVEIGEKHKGRTEVLSGLSEGDKILLEKP